MRLLKTLPVITLLFQFGCSNKEVKTADGNTIKPDVVVSRIDDLGSRPSWLKESEPFAIKDNEVTSLGSTAIKGDERIEAAYRIAENDAKSSIAKGIEQKLSFIFQNAEEGVSFDASQVRFIGSEVSRMTTSSIKLKNRYWEKYITYSDSGVSQTKYRIFTSVSMPESEFKRAVLDAIRKREGKGGISKEFAEKVNAEWDKLVE